MELTKKVKGIFTSTLVIAAMCFGHTAFSQETATPQQDETQQQQGDQKFTDTELEQFIEANKKATTIQKENQQEMISAIEGENLTVDRFNEIAKAHQQQKTDELGATPEEMASFNKAAQQVVEMQPAAKEEVEQAVQEEGLTMEKYEEILTAFNQDPEVKTRVQQLLNQ
ncbi:DUF4168 domain-containing protein [Pontibacter silvestris]|uniref:DUF4168 domain-containing protein n=1 Tax=Pontibacter silvestris TaxID=2305183 RepID=A0ABW4X4P3_9BACT|nr:DUF4168 domain-containing protein [Pontibacter silvestris]MCC9134835.1 DUF4168 domain-containing protein [Pontibacter silvestris]